MISASSATDRLGKHKNAGDAGIPTDSLLARPVATTQTTHVQYASGLHKHACGILSNVYEQNHLSEMQATHAYQKAAELGNINSRRSILFLCWVSTLAQPACCFTLL